VGGMPMRRIEALFSNFFHIVWTGPNTQVPIENKYLKECFLPVGPVAWQQGCPEIKSSINI